MTLESSKALKIPSNLKQCSWRNANMILSFKIARMVKNAKWSIQRKFMLENPLISLKLPLTVTLELSKRSENIKMAIKRQNTPSKCKNNHFTQNSNLYYYLQRCNIAYNISCNMFHITTTCLQIHATCLQITIRVYYTNLGKIIDETRYLKICGRRKAFNYSNLEN